MLPIKMPKVSLSTVIHLFIVAVFLGLLFYSKNLYEENQKLTKQYVEITVVYKQKEAALEECSKSTQALKKKEAEITKNAKGAVAEAKKESAVEYKQANDFIYKKPKAPVITDINVKNYGGDDTMIQMKDCLATHQLVNDAIDAELAK